MAKVVVPMSVFQKPLEFGQQVNEELEKLLRDGGIDRTKPYTCVSDINAETVVYEQ